MFSLNNHIRNYITPHYEYFKQYDTSLNFSYIENFFNSGVILYSPSHILKHNKFNFSENSALIKECITDGSAHREQALINYVIQNNIPINYLDQKWNVIDPDISEPMTGYMYHFTGKDWHGLKEKVKTYDWKL